MDNEHGTTKYAKLWRGQDIGSRIEWKKRNYVADRRLINATTEEGRVQDFGRSYKYMRPPKAGAPLEKPWSMILMKNDLKWSNRHK